MRDGVRLHRPALGLAGGAAGLALIVVARAGDKVGLGDSPEFGWKQAVLLAAGLVLLAVAGVLLGPSIGDIARERGTSPPSGGGASGVALWAAIAALAAAGIVLVWSRLIGIDQGLWHDEAFSVLTYARGGPRTILGSQEYVPNDHVLFNLLSWATVEVFSEDVALRRFWSVVPGIAAVALTVGWAWRRLGITVAVAVAILATASPIHLELAPQARGYGLAFLAGAGMLVAADRLATGGGRAALGGFAAAMFAGVATLPSFVFAAVPQAAPLFRQSRLRLPVLLAFLAVAVASLALYWSLLEDVLGNAGQELGTRLPWNAPITGPIDDLVGPALALLINQPYTASAAWHIAGIALIVLGVVELGRRRDLSLALLLLSPLIGTYLILVVGRFYTAPRFSSFVLFHALVLVALGVSGAVAVLVRIRVPRLLVGAVAAVLVAVALGRVLDVATRAAAVPREAFAEAAEVVRGAQIDRVISDSPRPEGLRYALGDRPLTVLPPAQASKLLCSDPGPLVFIEHPFTANPPPTDTRCLVRRGAARIRLPQRGDRGAFIDVWILPR